MKRSRPSRLARRFDVKRAAARVPLEGEHVEGRRDDEGRDFDESPLTSLFGENENENEDEDEDDEAPLAPATAIEPEASTGAPESDPRTEREPGSDRAPHTERDAPREVDEAPTSAPAPQPELVPQPAHEPQPELEPDPEPQPAPDTDPLPDLQPDPEPQPAPDTDPLPEPEPEPQPAPDTDPQPEPQPAPDTDPLPAPPAERDASWAMDSTLLLALPALPPDDAPAVISSVIAEAIASVKPPPPARVMKPFSLRETLTAQLDVARYTLRRTAGGVLGACLGAALGATLWGPPAAAPAAKPEAVARPPATHARARPAPTTPAPPRRSDRAPTMYPGNKAVALAGPGSPLNEIDVRKLLESIEAAVKRPSRPDTRASRSAGKTR